MEIQQDNERNTTLAFVTLTDGERDFAFNRHDTADFNIDFDQIDFEKYDGLRILHLGSLMLSEENGKEFAEKIAKKVKDLGVKLSFWGVIKTFNVRRNAVPYNIRHTRHRLHREYVRL